MNSVEASGHTRGLGWLWHFIPALWLLVGIAGFFALSFAPNARRTRRMSLAPNLLYALGQRIVGDRGSLPDGIYELVLRNKPTLIFDEVVKYVEGFWAEPYLLVQVKKRSASEIKPIFIERIDFVGRFLHKKHATLDR